MKKFFIPVLATVFIISVIGAFGVQKYLQNSSENYFSTISNTFQTTKEIKEILIQSADSLSVNDVTSTVSNFNRHLDESKNKLTTENNNLLNAEVPEKFVDSNKKILECLKAEYNLLDRIKDIVSLNNEYEAVENFNKTKDLMKNLKESSAMLSVDGKNFDEVFEFSPVYEKIEKFLNSRKQLRYDKDQKEQAEREKIAAQEKADAEQSKNPVQIPKNENVQGNYYVGIYPQSGLKAYLMTDTISRYRDGFSCTVVCYPSGKPYHINYNFNQNYDGFYFTNSDGYSEQVHSYHTPVEYNVWKYVW